MCGWVECRLITFPMADGQGQCDSLLMPVLMLVQPWPIVFCQQESQITESVNFDADLPFLVTWTIISGAKELIINEGMIAFSGSNNSLPSLLEQTMAW